MEITVNERNLTALLEESKSNIDLIEFLNQVIDEELEKENPDCDLIDDCVNAISELEYDKSSAPVLHLVLTCNSIKQIVNPQRSSWKKLNIALRAAIVAAMIATSTFTVNAAVKAVTGVDIVKEITSSIASVFRNDDDDNNNNNGELNTEVFVPVKETTTRPATKVPQVTTERSVKWEKAETTKSEAVTEATESNNKYRPVNTTVKVTEPTDPYEKPSDESVFTGIRAEFRHFKTAYIFGEELTYDGLTVYAQYSDNSERAVPLKDCAYSRNLDMNVTANYTLSVTYKACTVTVDITVRPDEATRNSQICSNSQWEYLLADKGAYITAYKGESKNVVADEIDGNSVYAITGKPFKNSDITSFASDSARVIYPGAFEDCLNLGRCNTPNVISIGENAFRNDGNLTDVTYSDLLTQMGNGAFEKTGVTYFKLPEGITAVPDRVCNGCMHLETVVLAGRVDTVGEMAFCNCFGLINVYGAENIKNVGYGAFSDNELMKFDAIPRLENVGASAFSYCASVEFGRIGESFKSLGEFAFDNCEGITEVIIPGCIETVPASCFNGVDFMSLTIENGVKRINQSAFRGFDVTELTIPSSVEYIGDYAIYSTTLRSITFESKNVEIAEMAFYKSRRTTLNVYENSTAQAFAEQNGLRYNLIKENEI